MTAKVSVFGNYKSLIFLFLIIFLGLLLMGRKTYFASLSLTPASTGDVKVVTESTGNNLTKVDLSFKTGPADSMESISTIAFRLKISAENQSKLKITDNNGTEVTSISSNQELIDTGNWAFPVNKFEDKDGNLLVDFVGVCEDKLGYKTSDDKLLATFYIAGVENKNNLLFVFDRKASEMFSKRRPVTDIWE